MHATLARSSAIRLPTLPAPVAVPLQVPVSAAAAAALFEASAGSVRVVLRYGGKGVAVAISTEEAAALAPDLLFAKEDLDEQLTWVRSLVEVPLTPEEADQVRDNAGYVALDADEDASLVALALTVAASAWPAEVDLSGSRLVLIPFPYVAFLEQLEDLDCQRSFAEAERENAEAHARGELPVPWEDFKHELGL